MESFTDSYSLAKFLLQNSVDRLMTSASQVSHSSLRSVGGACALLGFASLVERCESILKSEIASIDQLQSDHPIISDLVLAKFIRVCGKSQTHLRLVLDGVYPDAFDACQSDLEAEETALSRAVLGHIDDALDWASSRVEPDFRSDNVRFVCTIELFRRELWEDANPLLNVIFHQLGPISVAQMALGVNHRLPWSGYPFPDW